MRGVNRAGWGLAVLLGLLLPGTALAHRDDYLDETLVYLTLDRGEVEVEYWFDYGWGTSGSEDFLRHNVANEWGFTNHWMADGRATWVQPVGGGTRFDSGRMETRLRFGEEGEHPVDVAVSGEANWERDEEGALTFGLEPRLVLSKDVHETMNFTLNLAEEVPVKSGAAAPIASAGIRYNWTRLVRVGSELHYDLRERGGSAIPQIWLAFGPDLTLKFGLSEGLGRNAENFGRIALEAEL